MTGANIGYRRVSTIDQNLARQLDGLKLDRTFEDKLSGKDRQRPQLAAALAFCRQGDTLTVHSMDRLARNLTDLRKVVQELTERGIDVHFVKENLTFTSKKNPMSNLMLNLLGSVAEFEREMILERQREGIAIAKKAGKYKGRKPSLTPTQVAELRRRVKAGKDTKADLAEEYGISRETLYTYLRA